MALLNGVFVGVEGPGGGTMVFPARDYQTKAYNTFMRVINDEGVESVNFKFRGGIVFSVVKFNTSGLKGDYSSFCVLVNEKGENHILSNNEDLLKGFVGWKNRLTMQFGGSTKKRVSRKRTSRKRTSKKRVSKKRVSKKRVSRKRTSKKRVSRKRTSKKRVSRKK
jgi:hypothetical protein